MMQIPPYDTKGCGRVRALWGWGSLLVAALLLLPAACGERTTYKAPPAPKVTVSQPPRGPVVDYLEFTGNTQAINTVQLRARVQGYLEKVFFKDGDRVKKGQMLFIIQQNTYEDQLRQAEAQIAQQKANNVYAKIQVARYTELVKQKAGAQADLDNWVFQRDSSQAAIQAAEANRDLAKLNLSYTKVTAPFDGRIDRRLVDPGNLVGASEQTVLAEVNQINPIYIYFTMSEKDLLSLVGETKLSLEALSKKSWPFYFGLAKEKGYPHAGRLDFAAITVTQSTGTLLLRGIFPNPEAMIMPGLFARLRVPTGKERSVLFIPQVALGFDQQGPFVLVVNEKNIVERRSVTQGAEVETFRVVEEGLKGDEGVVVDGVLKAIPGRAVTPEKKELQAPAPQHEGAAPKQTKNQGKAGS